MSVSRQRLHPDGPELSRLVWGAWRAVDEPGDRHAREARPADRGLPGARHHQLRSCGHLWRLSRGGPFGAALREWAGERGADRADHQVRHRPGQPGAAQRIGSSTTTPVLPTSALRSKSSLRAARHRLCRSAAAASARPADGCGRDRGEPWRSWSGQARLCTSASPTTPRPRSSCCSRASRSRW